MSLAFVVWHEESPPFILFFYMRVVIFVAMIFMQGSKGGNIVFVSTVSKSYIPRVAKCKWIRQKCQHFLKSLGYQINYISLSKIRKVYSSWYDFYASQCTVFEWMFRPNVYWGIYYDNSCIENLCSGRTLNVVSLLQILMHAMVLWHGYFQPLRCPRKRML